MRSVPGTPARRLAVAMGVVAIAVAVAVPSALGTRSAGGPVTDYVKYTGGKAGKADPRAARCSSGRAGRTGSRALFST